MPKKKSKKAFTCKRPRLMTQKAFGELIGVKRQAISDYVKRGVIILEKGKVNPYTARKALKDNKTTKKSKARINYVIAADGTCKAEKVKKEVDDGWPDADQIDELTEPLPDQAELPLTGITQSEATRRLTVANAKLKELQVKQAHGQLFNPKEFIDKFSNAYSIQMRGIRDCFSNFSDDVLILISNTYGNKNLKLIKEELDELKNKGLNAASNIDISGYLP